MLRDKTLLIVFKCLLECVYQREDVKRLKFIKQNNNSKMGEIWDPKKEKLVDNIKDLLAIHCFAWDHCDVKKRDERKFVSSKGDNMKKLSRKKVLFIPQFLDIRRFSFDLILSVKILQRFIPSTSLFLSILLLTS